MNEAGRDEARAQALIDAITNTPMAEFVERRGELCSAANAARLTTKELVTALRARRELPRQLERSERDTLLAILGFADFEGRDEFVVQVDAARVTGYCSCLCASVDLEVDRDAPRSSARHDPIPNEAGVLNEAGDEIGAVMVFAEDGYLSCLEIFDWVGVDAEDDAYDPRATSRFPPLNQLRPRSRSA